MIGSAPASLSLGEYTRLLRGVIAREPALSERWITAELSDVSVRGGHCYMELVEKSAEGRMVAKMRATIWQSVYYRVRARFVAATGREFSSGIKLMLRGSANFHEVFGLSFNVSDVDPAYTMGDMERVRREILAALGKEGILDANKATELSPNPQRIAVISAPGAAGYGDFMNQLHANPYGIVFYTRLFESVMQGDRAAESVRRALAYVAMTVDLWDCVVIIRGGGASTDLNCFDNLELAREIALFPIPVIVGIGHERDRTVLDEIAHTRVKTPTAAAEFLSGRCGDSLRKAEDLVQKILSGVNETLTGSRRQLEMLGTKVRETGRSRISSAMSRLDSAGAVIPVIARRRIDLARGNMLSIAKMLPASAASTLSLQKSALRHLDALLRAALPSVVTANKEKLKAIEGIVSALSPDNTLRRGYSLTLSADGKAVKSSSALKEGEVLTTLFADGAIKSTINSIDKK